MTLLLWQDPRDAIALMGLPQHVDIVSEQLALGPGR